MQPKLRYNPVAAPPRTIQRCGTDVEDLDPEISVSAVMDMDPDFGGVTGYYQHTGPKVTLLTLSAAIDAGKICYSQDGGTTKHKVTKAKINELWDKKMKAPFARSGDLDWSRNCAEYATGTKSHEGDIKATKVYLNTKYEKVVDPIGGFENVSAFTDKFKTLKGEYVINLANHFVKMEIATAGSTVAMSQKDGESCVYSATLTAEQAAKLLYEDYANALIYKK